jgi:hypothetical protein
LVATLSDAPLAALAGNANFVVVALLTATTAVTRVGHRVDARVTVLAACGAHGASRYADTSVASRRIALALHACHTAVLRVGLQVNAGTIHDGQTGLAGALAVLAIRGIALALRIAVTATERIVLRIAAIVAVAIRHAADACATSTITQAEVVVAIVAAVAAVVDVNLEVSASIKACVLTDGADALTSRARSTRATRAALAAVVRIVRDVRAGVAAGNLTRGAHALTIAAGRAERAEESARSAVLDVGREFYAADGRTAIDGASRADASARRAHAIGTALVATDAAIIRVCLQIGTGVLRCANGFSGGTRRASAGNAHLAIEAFLAACTAVVQIRREVCATSRTRDLADAAGASARNTRRAHEAVFATHAAIVVVDSQVNTRIAAFRGSCGTNARARYALAAGGASKSATSAVVRVA